MVPKGDMKYMRGNVKGEKKITRENKKLKG